VVPPQQGSAFQASDPSANVGVVAGASPGSPGALFWLHSFVNVGAIQARLAGLFQWLNGIVHSASGAAAPRATDVGSTCDRLPPPRQRWKLLLAGDAWRQEVSTGQRLIAATRGCSGSGRWQDDGLSLWALPRATVLPGGKQASLVLDPGRVLRRVSVTFRGFLARPQDWQLGLYASTSTQGPIQTPVAACDKGSCSGLRLVSTSAGELVAPTSSSGDPDSSDQPPSASFTLPGGTRRIAWELACVAPGGCSVKGIANAAGVSPRPRDPLGHPAIFSIYRVNVS
jgi:hypothetical protein